MQEKYIIWNECGTTKGTLENNFNTRIRNERQVQTFSDMTISEARQYIIDYFKILENDIIVIGGISRV